MPENVRVAGLRRPAVKAVDDVEQEGITPTLSRNMIIKNATAEDDPFLRSAGELRTYTGVGRGVRQRATRLEKSFKGGGGAATTRVEEPQVTGYGLFDVLLPPYNMDYLAKVYEASSVHHSAVNAKAANIVGLGYLWEESDKTKAKVEDLDEAKTAKLRKKIEKARMELDNWIAECNTEDDFLETMRKVWIDYETTGNGFLEIGRTKIGVIHYLGHIPASTLRIRRLRDGYVQLVEKEAVFFDNFGERNPNPVGGDNTPNEIIHIKKYSPTNSFYGVPDIVSAMSEVAGNEFSTRYNLDYFENKAVPRYIIVIKGGKLTPTGERAVHEFFEAGLRGKHHRSLVVPLPADDKDRKVDVEMKPIEAGVQDSSFSNFRKANINGILMAHRVPASKVGIVEGVALAVSRDADKTFKEQVCRPEQRILENKLHKIVKEVTDIFFLRLVEMTLTDEDTQSKIDERDLRMQVIVPNERRAKLGYAARAGGDEPVDLKAQQAADQKATGQKSRARDAERSANATDSAGEARNVKGEGRTTP